jgi:hypothetical protein
MNHLTKFIKFNWKPIVLVSSGCYNTGQFYYQDSVQGYSGFCTICEWCNENTHVFPSAYNMKTNDVVIPLLTSSIVTGLFGGLSIPVTSYMTYYNYVNNKKYQNISDACLCGKLK